METVTRRLADFIINTKFESLPGGVVHEIKRIMLDSIGCALLSRGVNKGRVSIALAKRLDGPAESTVIGEKNKVSCAGAAFANSELINAMDMDVAVYPGGHVSPLVIPPCLALAESGKTSGKDLIVALALAHEIAQRIGLSLGGMKRYNKKAGKVEIVDVYGYSFSIFGGAAGAAKILRLGLEQIQHALGIAGYFAPPPTVMKWRNTENCAMTKYISAGWAAEGAVTSALLAQLGYIGDTSVFEGDYGYWKFSGSDRWRPENLFDKLGEAWRMMGTSYKLYPCCGTLLGSIDGFVEIIEENNLTPGQIENVKVFGDPFDDEPLWMNAEVRTQMDTEFKVPYIFALLAYKIKPGAAWQEPETMKNPDIKGFMKKVSLHPHPDFDRLMLEDRRNNLSAVEVAVAGKTYRKEKAWFRGGSFPKEAVLSDDEIKAKFRDNVSRTLTPERTEKAIKAVFELEKMRDVSGLMQFFAEG